MILKQTYKFLNCTRKHHKGQDEQYKNKNAAVIVSLILATVGKLDPKRHAPSLDHVSQIL
jgi:hypothetical protein